MTAGNLKIPETFIEDFKFKDYVHERSIGYSAACVWLDKYGQFGIPNQIETFESILQVCFNSSIRNDSFINNKTGWQHVKGWGGASQNFIIDFENSVLRPVFHR